MRQALLVSHDLGWGATLARAWSAAGDTVTIVLLDEAAAAARSGHATSQTVTDLLEAGIAVIAHGDALLRRGVVGPRLLAGVKTIDLDELADLVGDGADRVVWL